MEAFREKSVLAWGLRFILMVNTTMDNFRMIVFMGRDSIFGTIRSFILDYLRKDKKLKEGYKVQLDIKVSFERIKDMGLGHAGMRRVKFIAGNGSTERGTELAS